MSVSERLRRQKHIDTFTGSVVQTWTHKCFPQRTSTHTCVTSGHVCRSDGTVRSTVHGDKRASDSLISWIFDLCKPAKSLIPFPLYSSERSPSTRSPASARSDHASFVGNGSRPRCGPSGPAVVSVSLRPLDNRSHTCAVAGRRLFCVEPQECEP